MFPKQELPLILCYVVVDTTQINPIYNLIVRGVESANQIQDTNWHV